VYSCFLLTFAPKFKKGQFMQKNLVIVESPAKAKTIEKFLGSDYKVLSSYGHIRDLKGKEFSIDIKTFTPHYEIPEEKASVVEELKKLSKQVETVWLASDEDREGEAISWHLFEVLHLDPNHTKRIVFHEITKPAILKAIENPRDIDINLVNAQQARRVLDRIVGFKLSPVLWKKVKPALSAGRVQSVAVRLIVEREREIQKFNPESGYRVVASFSVPDGNGAVTEMKAELNTRFKTVDEVRNFLQSSILADYKIEEVSQKPLKRMPAAPFTTSTLQQEAARKLGFTVSQTMSLAQRLYESGQITYMRTDSTNLSDLCINSCKQVVAETMGEQYVHPRMYHTKVKGAQEAHEAIRPTYMDRTKIEGNPTERKLYELIWKRTIASQMADAEIEKTTVTVSINGHEEQYIASGEVVKFDGFLKVYRESVDDEGDGEQETALLPALTVGQTLEAAQVVADQRYTQRPQRYAEAGLVRKLEELGIGRPSTYAPTISTIQQREYVKKGDRPAETRPVNVLTLRNGQITEVQREEHYGQEKGKLIPTDIGIVVNDFLVENFSQIIDYNFTADIEKDFDEVAEGKLEWTGLMHDFYDRFEPMVEAASNRRTERKAGERLLGNDPKTGKPVSVKIGRFGPVVQIGTAEDNEKPRFAQMKAGQTLETITLEEAVELFKLPRKLGDYESQPVTIGTGKFGPYILHEKKYVSLPAKYDPMTITLNEAVTLIEEKRNQEKKSHLKRFTEEEDMELRDGRYGPYISYKGKNYRLSKPMAERVMELDYSECLEWIEKMGETTKPRKPRSTKK
jgi:DNA topoisomerase-1